MRSLLERGNMWTIVMGALAGLLGASYLGIKYWMPWLIYDLQFLWVILNGYLIPMTSDIKNRKLTIDRVEETVQRYPNKPMLVYGNTTFTYSECNAFANKVASTALSLGLKRGDVVAIILANEPDFVWTMIGLQKIGVQMAFINYNLRNESLVHVIKIAEPKMIFVSREKEIQRPVTDIHQALTGIPVYHFGEADDPNFLPLDPILEKSSEQNVGEDIRKQIRMTDNSLYIYTSGTTGATMVLKKKFSASNFIKDCRENKVTVVHYVGELFRYVSATPPNSSDTDHCIRCAFGNGLRIDVWKIMLERFKIPHIYEFYAATEMPVGLANISNTVGSVGRMSPLLKLTLPCEFVLYDEENENVVRTKEGLCMLAPLESPGLLLIKLDEKRRMTFEGYKGKESERKKKLVYNVLRQGDCYINTGDALTRDKNYFVYFADRLGDTFRWKGENVSTTEVANIFMELDILSDVCVYGVRIGDNEGKGGMAAISLKNQPEDLSLNTEQLLNIAQHCKKHLPSYARPRFIRVVKEFIYTSTFKQSKLKLKEEGYNLAEVASPVYYLDCKENTYTEMTPDVERDITSGTVKM
ncbi:long-chain fatty acid transport protein 2-like isoform X4 [Ostrea edulis]|uniref:long-chain fatty acid transport protein 2-like isoform X4 n=1 Tax=Ostrea edulis TaxID=37623 RepID=UPI0020964FB0|nr:long-chain fatty acid transport protein 2-like isoform X4 [Ostrea edulis]